MTDPFLRIDKALRSVGLTPPQEGDALKVWSELMAANIEWLVAKVLQIYELDARIKELKKAADVINQFKLK